MKPLPSRFKRLSGVQLGKLPESSHPPKDTKDDDDAFSPAPQSNAPATATATAQSQTNSPVSAENLIGPGKSGSKAILSKIDFRPAVKPIFSYSPIPPAERPVKIDTSFSFPSSLPSFDANDKDGVKNQAPITALPVTFTPALPAPTPAPTPVASAPVPTSTSTPTSAPQLPPQTPAPTPSSAMFSFPTTYPQFDAVKETTDSKETDKDQPPIPALPHSFSAFLPPPGYKSLHTSGPLSPPTPQAKRGRARQRELERMLKNLEPASIVSHKPADGHEHHDDQTLHAEGFPTTMYPVAELTGENYQNELEAQWVELLMGLKEEMDKLPQSETKKLEAIAESEDEPMVSVWQTILSGIPEGDQENFKLNMIHEERIEYLKENGLFHLLNTYLDFLELPVVQETYDRAQTPGAGESNDDQPTLGMEVDDFYVPHEQPTASESAAVESPSLVPETPQPPVIPADTPTSSTVDAPTTPPRPSLDLPPANDTPGSESTSGSTEASVTPSKPKPRQRPVQAQMVGGKRMGNKKRSPKKSDK
ncbi:hypothetical protein M422DRAFT_50583 [Sphaerobolus stellatus SS14]|uniref:Uncharacterized protein n=1 Tax=Sphaerobolus stellatus (strain SS14) TaxID=990650 RepID=A0A0C9V6V4_SPHS4|nr:hypothetical protein M422DRAFT_50583 [Sphaerobolus stellatus SS14]